MLEQHLAEVQAKVAALQQSMQALSLKIDHYRAVENGSKKLEQPKQPGRRLPLSGKAPEGKTSDDEHTSTQRP
jgi:hypothetical protein